MVTPFFTKLSLPAAALVGLCSSALVKNRHFFRRLSTCTSLPCLSHDTALVGLRAQARPSGPHRTGSLVLSPDTSFTARFYTFSRVSMYVFLGSGRPCCHRELQMGPDIPTVCTGLWTLGRPWVEGPRDLAQDRRGCFFFIPIPTPAVLFS